MVEVLDAGYRAESCGESWMWSAVPEVPMLVTVQRMFFMRVARGIDEGLEGVG